MVVRRDYRLYSVVNGDSADQVHVRANPLTRNTYMWKFRRIFFLRRFPRFSETLFVVCAYSAEEYGFYCKVKELSPHENGNFSIGDTASMRLEPGRGIRVRKFTGGTGYR